MNEDNLICKESHFGQPVFDECSEQVGRCEALLQRGVTAGRNARRMVEATGATIIADGNGQSLMEPTGAMASCVPPGMRKVQAGQFQMVVLHNDIVSDAIEQTGFWEIRSPQAFVAPALGSLPQNGTFLDIGANLGYYSFLFARQGFKVLAVEPMTRNRQAIEATLCLNPELRKLITVVPAALVESEDANTTTSCVIRSTNAKINIGNGQLHCGKHGEVAPCAKSDDNCENVPVKTLDAVLEGLKPSSVDLVKMDVEHYECHVLRGGQSLFEKYRPQYMQVETTSVETSTCVDDEAKKFKYKIFTKDANSLLARM